jgi:hypothetical protein
MPLSTRQRRLAVRALSVTDIDAEVFKHESQVNADVLNAFIDRLSRHWRDQVFAQKPCSAYEAFVLNKNAATTATLMAKRELLYCLDEMLQRMHKGFGVVRYGRRSRRLYVPERMSVTDAMLTIKYPAKSTVEITEGDGNSSIQTVDVEGTVQVNGVGVSPDLMRRVRTFPRWIGRPFWQQTYRVMDDPIPD